MQLKVNDIITSDGYTRKVLESLTNTVLLSYSIDHNKPSSWYTEEELLNDGWVFPKVVWKPEEDEDYWYIDETGSVCDDINGMFASDKGRMEIGNCYKTQAEAQEALKRVLQAYKG